MGGSTSNWEGVYLVGTTTGKPTSTINLSPRSITNDGWNPATPSTPGSDSRFKGIFNPVTNEFLIYA